MFGITQSEWAPVAAAAVSLVLILRVVYRYERMFVSDAREEVERVRAEQDVTAAKLEVATERIDALTKQVAQCRAESHIQALEVDRLRRLVEGIAEGSSDPPG